MSYNIFCRKRNRMVETSIIIYANCQNKLFVIIRTLCSAGSYQEPTLPGWSGKSVFNVNIVCYLLPSDLGVPCSDHLLHCMHTAQSILACRAAIICCTSFTSAITLNPCAHLNFRNTSKPHESLEFWHINEFRLIFSDLVALIKDQAGGMS